VQTENINKQLSYFRLIGIFIHSVWPWLISAQKYCCQLHVKCGIFAPNFKFATFPWICECERNGQTDSQFYCTFIPVVTVTCDMVCVQWKDSWHLALVLMWRALMVWRAFIRLCFCRNISSHWKLVCNLVVIPPLKVIW